jgi:hypothetical protein
MMKILSFSIDAIPATIAMVVVFIQANNSDPGKATLLAGDHSKQWSISNPSSNSCSNAEMIFGDNSFTFYSNGTCEYNNGSVTVDSQCKSNCCSDLVNFTGKWKFASNQTRLVVTALESTDDPGMILNVIVFDAAISRLDEDVLILTGENTTTHKKETLEFHKK